MPDDEVIDKTGAGDVLRGIWKMIITMDGLGCTGKSSQARELARKI